MHWFTVNFKSSHFGSKMTHLHCFEHKINFLKNPKPFYSILAKWLSVHWLSACGFEFRWSHLVNFWPTHYCQSSGLISEKKWKDLKKLKKRWFWAQKWPTSPILRIFRIFLQNPKWLFLTTFECLHQLKFQKTWWRDRFWTKSKNIDFGQKKPVYPILSKTKNLKQNLKIQESLLPIY